MSSVDAPGIIEPGRLYLAAEARQRLRMSVSVSTVDRWRKEAGLPCVKIDGAVLFSPEALREWAAARESQS